MRSYPFALILLLLAIAGLWPHEALFAQGFVPECGVTCEPKPESTTYGGGTIQARTKPRNVRGQSTLFSVLATADAPSDDTVLPGSESYNYVVPLLSLPGRNGLDVNLALFYNSRVWTIDSTNGTATFNADRDFPSYGFLLGYGYIEAVDSGSGGYLLVEPDGGKRLLVYASGKYVASDSSFIDFDLSSLVLRRKDGTRWKYQQVGTTSFYRPIEIKDTNGNFITVAYKSDTANYGKFAISTITDTLARVVTFNYDDQGSNPTFRLASITAPAQTSGTRTVATFTWGTTSLTYNFTLSVVDTQSSGSTINVLTECIYPSSTKYAFSYGGWGIVNQITFKSSSGNTRSSVAYNYPAGTTSHSDHPTFTTQTAFDGVNSADWTHAVTKSSGLVSAYSVTAPNGTKNTTNLYTSGWQTGLPSSVVVQNGTTTLRTVSNTWTQDATGNPILTAVTTTLNDSGHQSKVEFTYTTNGNVSDTREFDWGPTLFRKTQTDYETGTSYVNQHILDRPKQIRIYDKNGTLKARTDFAFDELC